MIENPILSNSLKTGDPVDLVEGVLLIFINAIFVIGVVVFFFMLIIGGIQWISSGGDKTALANAQARIRHAIIGLIVLMSSFAFVNFIEIVFQINILQIDIGGILTL